MIRKPNQRKHLLIVVVGILIGLTLVWQVVKEIIPNDQSDNVRVSVDTDKYVPGEIMLHVRDDNMPDAIELIESNGFKYEVQPSAPFVKVYVKQGLEKRYIEEFRQSPFIISADSIKIVKFD